MSYIDLLLKKGSHLKTLTIAFFSRGKKDFYSDQLELHFQLDLNYFVDFIIYYNGIFQQKLIHAIKTVIQNHDVELFIDIGSHIGQMSLFVGKHFPGIEIISFEPSPTTTARHKANMSRNNLSYNLLPIALSDHEGAAQLYMPKKTHVKEYLKFNDGRFSLLPSIDTEIDDSTVIKMTTLDKVLSNTQKSKKILIKMDVEGFELEVIRGATNILTQCEVILIIELTMKEQPEKCQKVINLLAQYGYKMYDLKLQKVQKHGVNENIDAIFMN